jgi:hypothetical protein
VTGSREEIYLDLAVLFGFWVLAGAVLSLVLLAQLNPTEGSLRARMFRGGWIGLRTGALTAPLCLLAYVVVVWVLRGVYLLLWKQQTWIANVESLQAIAGAGRSWLHLAGSLVFSGLLKGVALFGHHPAGPAVVLMVVIIAVIALAKHEAYLPAWILGVGAALTVMAPLLANLDSVFGLLLRAALVWVIPGLVLGVMSPLLRVSSEREKPKAWAVIAFASAAVLFVVTLLRFKHSWWLVVPTLLFVALGIALRRAARAEDYWLPMAAALAVLVGGLMLGIQNVTSFVGVYDSMHRINWLPSELAPRKPAFKPRTPLGRAGFSDLTAISESLRMGTHFGATIQDRVRSARDSTATLKELERNFTSFETAAEKFKIEVAHAQTVQIQVDAHAKWFDYLIKTIERHRELSAMLQRANETAIVPLEKLRGQVTIVQAPSLGLGEIGVQPRPTDPPELPELRRLRSEIDRLRTGLLSRIDTTLRALQPAKAQLAALEAPVDATERRMRDTMIRWLELALAGSLGYWTAISLLVGWSMQRQTPPAA